jgi:hypothetical protein
VLLSAVVALAALMVALYCGYTWATSCDRDCRAERLLLSHQVVPAVHGMPPCTPRPDIEAILTGVIGHSDQSYVVLTGPRGAGKTRVVEMAASNRGWRAAAQLERLRVARADLSRHFPCTQSQRQADCRV